MKTPEANAEIRAILGRRARLRSKSLRWNSYALVLAYGVAAVAIVVAVQAASDLFAALVAIPGLIALWLYGNLRGRKLEAELFEEEVQTIAELLNSDQGATARGYAALPGGDRRFLSDRELQVLEQIARGDSNREAAAALHISELTVKNHLSHIFEKLKVGDRTSAVLVAVSRGWISMSGSGGAPAKKTGTTLPFSPSIIQESGEDEG